MMMMRMEAKHYLTRSRLLVVFVLLSLTLPFLDVSRVVLVSETDQVKPLFATEKKGPFLITSTTNGRVVQVDARPQLFNVTDVVHVVKSRFLPRQASFKILGWARFRILKHLCVPSMAAQTSQNFVWIIYADPGIGYNLRRELLKMLQPHANFYLVLAHADDDEDDRLFRGGNDVERLDWEDVVSGNVQRLRYVLRQRDRFPYLETRLDEYAGLHADFVRQVQARALRTLHSATVRWTFWCIPQALEWHWVGSSCGASDEQRNIGALVPSRVYREDCHATGMTLGLYRAHDDDDIVSHSHNVAATSNNNKNDLWSTLEREQSRCGPTTSGTDCIIHLDEFRFAALRANSLAPAFPTTAGVAGLLKQQLPTQVLEEWNEQATQTWTFAKRHFGIKRSGCEKTAQYIDAHRALILEDVKASQCTEEYLCRVGFLGPGMLERFVCVYDWFWSPHSCDWRFFFSTVQSGRICEETLGSTGSNVPDENRSISLVDAASRWIGGPSIPTLGEACMCCQVTSNILQM